MISLSTDNKQFSMNLRYKDYFIDFLACLIPGFIFLIISITIILSTIYLFISIIDYDINIQKIINYLISIKGIIYFPFWLHVSIFILSYMFGFFLYRQDPKMPDHVSYLKNRKTVKGYNEWVVENTSGLLPREVQFPYCNLSSYLSSRGFVYDDKIINWSCYDEGKDTKKDASKNHRNRSKAFINKLKMRINFFFPEVLSSIIKNEAHIRFSSSMWYGFTVIIKLLYCAIILLIIYENIIIYNAINESFFTVISNLLKNKLQFDIKLKYLLINIPNFLIILYWAYSLYKKNNIKRIYESEKYEEIKKIGKKKKIESFIDAESLKLCYIYLIYDLFPFFSFTFFTINLYLFLQLDILKCSDSTFLLLLTSCLLSVLSFFIFYAKRKIESSFHYQRVREIIYVIEIANLAKVITKEDIEKLYELFKIKIGQQPKEEPVKIITPNSNCFQ